MTQRFCGVCGKRIRKARSCKRFKRKKYCSLACTYEARRSGVLKNKRKGYKRWKSREVRYLRDNYLAKGARSCAMALGRSIVSVRLKANRMRLISNPERRIWKEDELKALREGLLTDGVSALSKRLNRSEASIHRRLMMYRESSMRAERAKLVPIQQVAKLFCAELDTVKSWIQAGILMGAHQGRRFGWRVHPRDVQVFAATRPDVYDIREVNFPDLARFMGRQFSYAGETLVGGNPGWFSIGGH